MRDPAGEELRDLQQRLPHRPLGDHHQIELAVVEARIRRDQGAVPVLAGIGDRDDERADVQVTWPSATMA